MSDSRDDDRLVEQFQQGNKEEREAAFAELYRRHEKSLRWYLTRMTKSRKQADDIAQEAFLKALEALDDFEPRATFKTWLFQIATNTLRNKMNKKRPAGNVDEGRTPSKSGNPVENVKQQETIQEVRSAVDQLSEKLRAALILVQFEDMKYREAARALDISLSALKARMSRAYEQLSEILLEE